MNASSPNLATKEWSVHIYLSEEDGNTRAVAHLDTGAGTNLNATGMARLNPQDADVPEIGDELAAGRALADLARVLLRTAEEDVQDATGTSGRP